LEYLPVFISPNLLGRFISQRRAVLQRSDDSLPSVVMGIVGYILIVINIVLSQYGLGLFHCQLS
jgi:hypothetical protein